MTPLLKWTTPLVCLVGTLASAPPVCAADALAGPPVKRLTAMSMPVGGGVYAEAAKGLLPSRMEGFTLVNASGLDAAPAEENAAEDTEALSESDGVVGDAPEERSIAEQAREAALAFNLVAAAELWRRAADSALKTEEMLLAPRRTAKLMLEAGAAAVAADERDLALVYFRKSIALDGDISPGPDISPDAKELFQQAVSVGPLVLEAPRESVLERVCEAQQVAGILWTAVGVENGEWVVLFKKFIKGEAVGEVETKRFAAPLTDTQIAAEQRRFERLAVGARPPVPQADDTTPKPPVIAKRPWYKKWWFYTAVGAVLIVGGAVGVGVWAASQPDTVDATLHY